MFNFEFDFEFNYEFDFEFDFAVRSYAGFQNCVDKWCPQIGTDGQYTKCDDASADGQTCYNPEIKYGSTVGGRPVVLTERCYRGIKNRSQETLDWCKQLFPKTEQANLTTNGRGLGRGEGFVSFDSPRWPNIWFDTKDGVWKDTARVNGHFSSIIYCMKRIESVTCQQGN